MTKISTALCLTLLVFACGSRNEIELREATLDECPNGGTALVDDTGTYLTCDGEDAPSLDVLHATLDECPSGGRVVVSNGERYPICDGARGLQGIEGERGSAGADAWGAYLGWVECSSLQSDPLLGLYARSYVFEKLTLSEFRFSTDLTSYSETSLSEVDGNCASFIDDSGPVDVRISGQITQCLTLDRWTARHIDQGVFLNVSTDSDLCVNTLT